MVQYYLIREEVEIFVQTTDSRENKWLPEVWEVTDQGAMGNQKQNQAQGHPEETKHINKIGEVNS